MTTTTHLGLTLVEQAQAQKEVTVNMALSRLDAILNTGAKDKDLNTPPASPSAGDVYIVGASPTGDWAGKALQVAYYDQLWRFIIPNEGLTLWVNDENIGYTYDGAAWARSFGGGKATLYIPASRLLPASVNGCAALATTATAANRPDIHSLDFDAATEEYAQCSLRMPKSWNLGSVSAVFEWSHASASGAYATVWGIQAVGVSDAGSINAVYGTAQEVTDTGGTADTLYKSPETSVITASGSLSSMDTLYFRIYRKAASAGDTLSVDARLHGIALFYTANKASDD